MIRKLKTLGVALVVVFALGAMAAQAAGAADTFTSDSGTNSTIFTGNQVGTNVFSLGGASVSCPVARFTGTKSGNSVTSVTVHPEYEGNAGGECQLSPIGSLTFTTTGCNYIITSETHENAAHEKHGTFEIECATTTSPSHLTHEITINGPCVIHVPGQSEAELEGGVVFENGTETVGGVNKKDVKITATVTGITAVVTDSFACTIGGLSPGTYNNATYKGSITFTGYVDNSGSEGAVANIEVS